MPPADLNLYARQDDEASIPTPTTTTPPLASVAPTTTSAAASAPAPALPFSGTVPQCITLCMAHTDNGSCKGPADFPCLCANTVYHKSVSDCWKVSCSEADYNAGMAFATYGCSTLGVLPDIIANGTRSPIAVNTLLGPVVISRAAWNIQAVMSSVCSLVLLLALVLGILNCRNQIKREQASNQKWSHVVSGDKRPGFGLRSMDTQGSGGETFSQFLRSGPGRHGPPGPLDSIIEDGEGFTLSFPAPSIGPSVNRPYRNRGSGGFGGPKFTNRLSPEEVEGLNGGGFEMTERKSSSGSMVESSGSEVDLDATASQASLKDSDKSESSAKGKEKEVETYTLAAAARVRLPEDTSSFAEVPLTPTTPGMASEFGSSIHLHKVAGE